MYKKEEIEILQCSKVKRNGRSVDIFIIHIVNWYKSDSEIATFS